MARIPLMAGNWKMYMTTGEAVKLTQDISYKLHDADIDGAVEILLCPPHIDLKSVANVLEFDKSVMELGAQNVYWEDEGAFTGEISPIMLKEVGCKYCIIGHSERREMFGETDETVNKKAKALISHGITPIVCCGESEAMYDRGMTKEFVTGQIRAGLAGLTAADVAKMVIAYEPIWAIGTGKVPTPEIANAVCAAIRTTVVEMFDAATADGIRILYGGSVKPENVKLFMPEEHIDGALVGGAALNPESFIALVKGAC